MAKALFIGRFQPFHKGHLETIRYILSENDLVIIGVGSAQYSGTPENPWSGAERETMINVALSEAAIPQNKYKIVLIPDIHDYSSWPGHVKSFCGDFDCAYSRNPLPTRLFKANKIIVKEQPDFSIEAYNGANIRCLMAKDDSSWEELVTPSIKTLLKGALKPKEGLLLKETTTWLPPTK